MAGLPLQSALSGEHELSRMVEVQGSCTSKVIGAGATVAGVVVAAPTGFDAAPGGAGLNSDTASSEVSAGASTDIPRAETSGELSPSTPGLAAVADDAAAEIAPADGMPAAAPVPVGRVSSVGSSELQASGDASVVGDARQVQSAAPKAGAEEAQRQRPELAAPVAVALAPEAVSLAAPAGAASRPAATSGAGGGDASHSGEVRLLELLGSMDQHMQQLRELQQGLVAATDLACRCALGHQFGGLVLVGSAALRVETPGSDVDVVCFTRRDACDGSAGYPADILRRIHWAFTELCPGPRFNMELIHDARVPILRVSLRGHPGSVVAVDVSVDQQRPVDHVHWFQRVGAAPRPQARPPAVAPLVTLTLRCVKWWLRQRQIPRTKEGGLPTMAWLLMAVHVCSRPETHVQVITNNQRPMAALLASLKAFFSYYGTEPNGIDGVLTFAADGCSSNFERRPRARPSAWYKLSVIDPTRAGAEQLDLAPRLYPATQLLIACELKRARSLLTSVPQSSEDGTHGTGLSRRLIDEAFESLPEASNELPSSLPNRGVLGALLLFGDASNGGETVELAVVDQITPRLGWQAPFLHRSDDRSELRVRFLDVDERAARAVPRKRTGKVVVPPNLFVCSIRLERDGANFRLNKQSLIRIAEMKELLQAVRARLQAPQAQQQPQQKQHQFHTAIADAIAGLPSPSRAIC
eukprot:TRINITY_DN23354_c0_g1_i1.p1 TRINITY_DN23354_c0_g1~~TRINITY_DN23354_c0_g1_i1.p1  ORF type:complete len:696 (+),score=138.13 TRINITY_DN23354_c0_g1_i1:40-2127(+)